MTLSPRLNRQFCTDPRMHYRLEGITRPIVHCSLFRQAEERLPLENSLPFGEISFEAMKAREVHQPTLPFPFAM